MKSHFTALSLMLLISNAALANCTLLKGNTSWISGAPYIHANLILNPSDVSFHGSFKSSLGDGTVSGGSCFDAVYSFIPEVNVSFTDGICNGKTATFQGSLNGYKMTLLAVNSTCGAIKQTPFTLMYQVASHG